MCNCHSCFYSVASGARTLWAQMEAHHSIQAIPLLGFKCGALTCTVHGSGFRVQGSGFRGYNDSGLLARHILVETHAVSKPASTMTGQRLEAVAPGKITQLAAQKIEGQHQHNPMSGRLAMPRDPRP